jgi:hypothetical protein
MASYKLLQGGGAVIRHKWKITDPDNKIVKIKVKNSEGSVIIEQEFSEPNI